MRGILLDMDGVLYNCDGPVACAAQTVLWVRQQSIPYLFVTNTTSVDRNALVEQLHGFGVEASVENILTPAATIAEWLQHACEGPVALFLRPSARGDFSALPCLDDEAETGAAHVVIGDLGDLWDYRTLNRAFRLLHNNPRAQLIALGTSRYWRATDGIVLDLGPFVAALECATGRSAVVFGKPAERFFLTAAERLVLPPSEVLMVGDDIEVDIGGAQAAGLKGALVKTGRFWSSEMEKRFRPTAVWESLGDLPAWWRHANENDSDR